MRASQLYFPTIKESPADTEIISHQLMIRAGLIRRLAAGIYTWLPLGLRILRQVEQVVREEMDRVGAQECLLPMIQPGDLWKETKRWDAYGPELLRFQDRHQRDFCLGPTHEEVITDLVRREVHSYKQLPIIFYQMQTKFRDEIRPRFGVMRSREFMMKDAYSFHASKASLEATYQTMYHAYIRIFERLGLIVKVVQADTGSIGGHTSHEFHVLADVGEDTIVYSPDSEYAANVELINAKAGNNVYAKQQQLKQARGIEVGHIFQLGTKYSHAMKSQISTKEGKLHSLEMGCYGIGLSRIVAAAIEQHHDEKGIRWPKAMAPFQLVIVPVGYFTHDTVKREADNLYQMLKAKHLDVLFDDRGSRPGTAFAEMDLIGIPHRIVISEKGLLREQIEYSLRGGQPHYFESKALLEHLESIV